MAENLDVLAALGRKEEFLHKVTENVELAGRFMGIISMLVDIADSRGMSFEGVQIGPVAMSGRRMTARATFSKLSIPRSFESVPECDSFVEFMAAEAKGLHLFVLKNPDIVKWLQAIVTRLDAYARDKGKKFEELTFTGQALSARQVAVGDFGAFMTPDDYIVVEVDR